MEQQNIKKASILGVPVSLTTIDQLTEQIHSDLNQAQKRFIIAINPEKVMKARKDPKLSELLKKADYAIADGIGILWASRIYGKPIKERVTGIDCMQRLCRVAQNRGSRVFLYGAHPDIVRQAKEVLERTYPGIHIAGIQDGYETDENIVIDKINQVGTDILFVALGSPKQEYWITRNMDRIQATIFQGVGGSFDVLSGRLKRAPAFFLNHGLEWFYRLLQQPGRIFRQAKLIGFVFLVLANRLMRSER